MARQRKSSPPPVATPSASEPISKSSSWKDHPIVVAAMAVAGTIALGVLLVKEVILPTHTAALTNEVASLSAEASSLRASKADTDDELAKLQTQVAELDRKLAQAQHANLFTFGSPYPVGVGQVRVGDPISSLTTIYPATLIDKNEIGYWSVNNQHKVFNSIVYYYDEKLPKNPITHIMFSVTYPVTVDDTFLQSKLVEALGAPKQWHRKGYFSWDTQANVTLYKNDEDSFIVMDNGSRPGAWPDE